MNQEAIQTKMRQRAKELLNSGAVTMVLGWEAGTFWYQSTPILIRQAEDADKLVWNDFCQNNLSKYLLDFRFTNEKIALFLKGCDSRAFNRLLQDKQIEREKTYIIGIPCEGMKDHRLAQSKNEGDDLPLAKICQSCRYPNPVIYDELLIEEVTPRQKIVDFSDVEAIERMSADERYEFWQKEHTKCIRCYACRNVCPACNCRKCIFDQTTSGWNSKDVNASENQFYAMTRAIHIAGRCIECGQCEYVCPANIPIMLMNKKLIKDIDLLFGDYDAGLSIEGQPPLGHFEKDDPEEFM